MFELNNHIHTPDSHSLTRLKSSLFVPLYMFAALLGILFILPPPASALDITSQKTERHVLVPGTNAFFAPASGLVLASEFGGFESKNRRIEVIVAYLDGPISGIEAGFTEASFESLGMNLLAKGDFTIDSRRAVLYKVLHDDGNMRWGKWVMLAENGPGTLVVNAVFVSGDADAAVQLEQMLKGVYMEPAGAAAVAATSPNEPARREVTHSSGIPPDALRGANLPAGNANSINEGQDGFDRMEALSILARDVTSSPDATPQEERGQSAEPAGAEQERSGSARIITEDGVIYVGDSAAAEGTDLEEAAEE